MELKDYVKIITKRSWILVAAIAIVMIGVYYYTTKQVTTYDSSAYLYITVKSDKLVNADYYEYDNYYAQSANNLLADTMLAWLQDPSFVYQIFDSAKLSVPDVNISDISKLITTKKKPGGVVQITYNSPDKELSENVVKSAVNFAKIKTGEWVKSGMLNNVFVDSSNTVASVHKVDMLLNMLIALFSGIVLGLIFVFLTDYFSKEK